MHKQTDTVFPAIQKNVKCVVLLAGKICAMFSFNCYNKHNLKKTIGNCRKTENFARTHKKFSAFLFAELNLIELF